MCFIDGMSGFLIGNDMGECSFVLDDLPHFSKQIHDETPVTCMCIASSLIEPITFQKARTSSRFSFGGSSGSAEKHSGLTLFSGAREGLRIWRVRAKPKFDLDLVRDISLDWHPTDIQADFPEKASKIFVAYADKAEIEAYSPSGQLLTTYYGHKTPGVSKLLVLKSPQSENMFVSCGADGTARWWNITNEQCGVPLCWTKFPDNASYSKFETEEIPQRRIIFVELSRATNVPICDPWFSGGAVDPYIEVEVFRISENNSRTLLGKIISVYCPNNLNPFWGEMLDVEIPCDVPMSEILVKLSMYDFDFIGDNDFIGYLESPLEAVKYEKGMNLKHSEREPKSCVSKNLVEQCVVYWRAGFFIVDPGTYKTLDPTTTIACTALAELPITWARVPMGMEDRVPKLWRLAVGYENGCVVVYERHGVDVIPKLRMESDPLAVSSIRVWRDRIFVDGSNGFVREYDFLWRYLGRIKLHDGMIDSSIGLECGIFVLATYRPKQQVVMLSLWH